MITKRLKSILLKIYKHLPVKLRFIISYIYSDKFVVGMIAFVVKDKKILLLKHTYQYEWALPGGWMQRGEDLYQTMEREIKEEIGLDTKVTEVFEVRSVITKPVIDVAVICSVVGGRIVPDKIEIEKATFFSFDSLPSEIIYTHKPYIEKYLDSLKYRR